MPSSLRETEKAIKHGKAIAPHIKRIDFAVASLLASTVSIFYVILEVVQSATEGSTKATNGFFTTFRMTKFMGKTIYAIMPSNTKALYCVT